MKLAGTIKVGGTSTSYRYQYLFVVTNNRTFFHCFSPTLKLYSCYDLQNWIQLSTRRFRGYFLLIPQNGRIRRKEHLDISCSIQSWWKCFRMTNYPFLNNIAIFSIYQRIPFFFQKSPEIVTILNLFEKDYQFISILQKLLLLLATFFNWKILFFFQKLSVLNKNDFFGN